MKGEFEIIMMGELNFFLGLQIIPKDYGIFTHQEKYTKDLLKRFIMNEDKPLVKDGFKFLKSLVNANNLIDL